MKTFILAAIYAAIVTGSEGCDIIKRMTGREWPELDGGTKAMFWIMGISLAVMLFFIGQYLASPSRPEQK